METKWHRIDDDTVRTFPCWESDGKKVWLARDVGDTLHALYWSRLIKPFPPIPVDVINWEPHPTQMIDDAFNQALSIAKKHNKPVRFRFNSLPLFVKPDQTLAELCWLWDFANLLRQEYKKDKV